MLNLYPATSLNLAISSNSLLVESLGFSMYKNMSPANRDNFTSSFPIWMPFIYLSCLTALARTSSTMLNRSGDSEHPCLVPNLRGKAFIFSPLKMMLAVGLLYMAFIMLRCVPTMSTFSRVFYHKWVLNFFKRFFCIYWDDYMTFILQFVNVVYHND